MPFFRWRGSDLRGALAARALPRHVDAGHIPRAPRRAARSARCRADAGCMGAYLRPVRRHVLDRNPDADFDGTLFGMQAGLDIYGWETDSGHHDRIGLFIGHTRMSGDVKSPTSRGPIADSATSTQRHQPGRQLDPCRPRRLVSRRRADGHLVRWRCHLQRRRNLDIGGTGVTASLEGGDPDRTDAGVDAGAAGPADLAASVA